MSRLKLPAALLVMGAMSLGAPASAAPLTSLSAAAARRRSRVTWSRCVTADGTEEGTAAGADGMADGVSQRPHLPAL